MLAVLEHNPGQTWTDLIDAVTIEREVNPDLQPLDQERQADADPDRRRIGDRSEDDELATFKL